MLIAVIVCLAGGIVFLLFKLYCMRKDLQEICIQFASRMQTDTNIGIDTASADPGIRRLAADLDRQLKLLRQKQILYTRGDQEVKTAVTHISHDLRTPLTAIYGYLSLLEDEEMTKAAAGYLSMIKNRADVLKVLAEELFRYSVILSVDVSAQYEEVTVNAVLEESLAGYYGKSEKKTAEWLIEKGFADFVGTDMHNMRHCEAIEAYIGSKDYYRHAKALKSRLFNDKVFEAKP